ncbi:MAG: amidohydrolase [Ruminiclostridium sp.]|nr:amidohydrolase [Ruminiclostridium sp.]
MIIDTHIHAYTESLAERVVAKLTEIGDCPCFTDGTISGARKLLAEKGIDYGVLLPIATKPTQQTTINNWVNEVKGRSIIPFGTVHPFAPDALDELDRIKSMGFKGLKLHNDYQGVYIFDEACQRIYKRCEELGLPVVFHMGYDPVSPIVHHAMPYDLIELSERYPKLNFIGAHMAGNYAWEHVLRYVAGLPNVYMDTAYVAKDIDRELFATIVKKHGTDKILFASDLPWSDPKTEIELVDGLDIPDSEKDRIFWRNAAELLGLDL